MAEPMEEVVQMEEQCVGPCESHKSFRSSMMWVIGIMVVLGSGSIGYSIRNSEKALNEVNELKEEVADIKTALMGELHGIRLSVEQVHGDVRVQGEIIRQLERME